LSMGAGQFCTKPGVAFIIDGPGADAFVNGAVEVLSAVEAQTLLTDSIAAAFHTGTTQLQQTADVRELLASSCELRTASPGLFETTSEKWQANPSMHEEIFGPVGLVVRVRNEAALRTIAQHLGGQLTCTI